MMRYQGYLIFFVARARHPSAHASHCYLFNSGRLSGKPLHFTQAHPEREEHAGDETGSHKSEHCPGAQRNEQQPAEC